MTPTPQPPLHLVRPEIRAERAYRVPTTTEALAKVDQNESPFDCPPEIKRAALARFAEEPWNRYPDDRPHRLVAALAERHGWPAEGVIVGRGSNELTHTLGLCFYDAGTPVVLPTPMFALYASVARMHGARIVPVAPEPDLSHSADAILGAAVESGAAVTVVTTPNNPTGRSVSHDDLRRLAAGVPGLLLIDEAYYEFQQGPDALDLLREFPNVLVQRTFSKAMGLAGIRLGVLLGHPELVAEIEKARLPFLVDRLSEAVGLEILARPELVAERVAQLKAERAELEAFVAGFDGTEVIPSTANFFLFRTPLPADVLRARLAEAGVLVRDVTGYPELAPAGGRPGWLRVSVGSEAETGAFRTAFAAAMAGEPVAGGA